MVNAIKRFGTTSPPRSRIGAVADYAKVRRRSLWVRASIATGLVCLASGVFAFFSPSFSGKQELDSFDLAVSILTLVTGPSFVLTIGFALIGYLNRRRNY